MFKEGAAVVTDLLILSLAAIFMNWSIRLPWDWYYSTQAQVREAVYDEDVILEEDEDETAVNSTSSLEQTSSKNVSTAATSDRQAEAAAKLRKQEVFALLSTFLCPALAAYMLHLLRGQLSAPSTGLVSDYNLSIFLLVAEIRPSQQLIRLMKRRTLHLQRTVTGLDDPFGSAPDERTAVSTLTARINELEERLSRQAEATTNGHVAKKADLSDLSSEVKKRYETRIDALERAVRRYEKRTTTLAMVTEQRLKTIDIRLQDTLSLAAVAAQQSNKRGAAARLMDNFVALALWPLRMAGVVVMLPIRALEDVYARVKGLLFGQSAKKAGKRSNTRSYEDRDDISKDRGMARKPVTR